jgi:hypothetical protein
MREINFLINSQNIELNKVTVFLMYCYIYVDHSNLLHCWAHSQTDTNSTADSCQAWLGHIRGSNDKIKFGHSNINHEHTALSHSAVH